MEERNRVGGESRNIVSEKIRRQKFNDSLYALRSVVPNITKMDKVSVIKDAIEYMEWMQSEERRMEAEISEMESRRRILENSTCSITHHSSSASTSAYSSHHHHHPIQILELRVRSMREEKMIVVSLMCSKAGGTLVRVCEMLESLDLQIITANISSSSGTLCYTLFLQGDEDEEEVLSFKIKNAIAALNDPDTCI